MIRRSHKKSRNGCSQCKQRHIKCDETRPICHHCRMAERRCDFEAIEHDTERLSTGPSESSSQNTSNEGWNSQDLSLSTMHIEALLHFDLNIPFPDFTFEDERPFRDLMMRLALETPWLLHELLAISLTHIAWCYPNRSSTLLAEARKLQTTALELFRQHNNDAGIEEHVSGNVMFASVLHRQQLAETLTFLQGTFDEFLPRYIKYTRISRGPRTLASTSWPKLLHSELQAFIEVGRRLYDTKPYGNDLDDLKAAVKSSKTLTSTSIDHCVAAIDLLQIGLDNLKDPNRIHRYQMACNWSTMAPPEFMDLLEGQKPEALVIFGHYAVLLHSARHIWQIGNCGIPILQGIADHVSPEWGSLLTWPLTVVQLSDGFATRQPETGTEQTERG